MAVELKPYPKYKDSGVPWLGEIPTHWELHKGKRLFAKMEREVYPEDEVVTCFRDGIVTLRKNRRTTGFTESLKEIGYQGIRKGDLIIHMMDAFAGAIGVSDSDGKGTPVYSVCQPKLDLNTYFYSYVFREMARSDYILALAKGIRERSTDFRFDTFSSQILPVPPKQEQDQISAYIHKQSSKISRFIRKKRSLIKLLNEQKQIIINQAVTRGLDRNIPIKPSKIPYLGDIPNHWETISLRRLVSKIEQGWSPVAENRLVNFEEWGVIKLSAISKGQFLELKHKALGKLPPKAEIQIKPGNFLVTRSNTPKLVGEACLVRDVNANLIISDLVYRLSLHLSKVHPEFLNWLWQNPIFRYQISIAAYGSSLSMVKISHQRLLSTSLPLPQLQEQIEISEFLQKESQKLDLGIKHAQDEIVLMQEYRTRLISDVVTGKIDVRDIEIPALPDDEAVEELEGEELLEAAEAELEEIEDADE